LKSASIDSRSVFDAERTSVTEKSASDAVVTVLSFGISQLARVFHQEARLTNEFVGTSRLDLAIRVTTIVMIGVLLFVVVLFFLFDNESLLEDYVKAGFDIFAVLFIFLFVVVGLWSSGTFRRSRLYLGVIVDHDQFVVINSNYFSTVIFEQCVVIFGELFVTVELHLI